VNLSQEIEDLAMLLSVEDHFGKSESAAWTRRTFTTLLAFGGGPESETSLQLEDLVESCIIYVVTSKHESNSYLFFMD
jgi:hypothetical protein